MELLWPKCWSQYLALLNLIQLMSAHLSSLSESLYRGLELPANLMRMQQIPSARSFIKILNKTSPKPESWGTPLVPGWQLDLTPFTTMLWIWQLSHFFNQCSVHSSKPWAASFPRRMLWEIVSNIILKSRQITSPAKYNTNANRTLILTDIKVQGFWSIPNIQVTGQVAVISRSFLEIDKSLWQLPNNERHFLHRLYVYLHLHMQIILQHLASIKTYSTVIHWGGVKFYLTLWAEIKEEKRERRKEMERVIFVVPKPR